MFSCVTVYRCRNTTAGPADQYHRTIPFSGNPIHEFDYSEPATMNVITGMRSATLTVDRISRSGGSTSTRFHDGLPSNWAHGIPLAPPIDLHALVPPLIVNMSLQGVMQRGLTQRTASRVVACTARPAAHCRRTLIRTAAMGPNPTPEQQEAMKKAMSDPAVSPHQYDNKERTCTHSARITLLCSGTFQCVLPTIVQFATKMKAMEEAMKNPAMQAQMAAMESAMQVGCV